MMKGGEGKSTQKQTCSLLYVYSQKGTSHDEGPFMAELRLGEEQRQHLLERRMERRESIKALPYIITLSGLIYRQCDSLHLFSLARMADAGGTTALEKASAKSNRTRRCCWRCTAAVGFDGLVACNADGSSFL